MSDHIKQSDSLAGLPEHEWFTMQEAEEWWGVDESAAYGRLRSLAESGSLVKRAIPGWRGGGGVRYLYWQHAGPLSKGDMERRFQAKAQELLKQLPIPNDLAIQASAKLLKGEWMTIGEISYRLNVTRTVAYARMEELVFLKRAIRTELPEVQGDMVRNPRGRSPQSLYVVLPADQATLSEKLAEKIRELRADGIIPVAVDKVPGDPYWTPHMRCRYCDQKLGKVRPRFIGDAPYHAEKCYEAGKKVQEAMGRWPIRGIIMHSSPYKHGLAVYVTHLTSFSQERVDELHDENDNSEMQRWWPVGEVLMHLIARPEPVLAILNKFVSKWETNAKHENLPFHIDEYLLTLLGLKISKRDDGTTQLVQTSFFQTKTSGM